MDDEQLARRVGQADEDAFRELYGRHSGAVYGLLCRRGGPDCDASELLQETWLHAVRHLPLFHGQSDFRTWLTGIALNCHRESRRRHSHERPFWTAFGRGSAIADDLSSPDQEPCLNGPEIAPPAGDEDRLVAALRQRGLLRSRRRSARLAWSAAAVAIVIAASAWLLW